MSEPSPGSGKVAYEIVAFRYSDERSLMLIGEAEIVVETFMRGDDRDESETNTSGFQTIRVDILTVYDADDRDAYDRVMADADLKARVEAAALAHYFHPPQVPIGLPKRIVEW